MKLPEGKKKNTDETDRFTIYFIYQFFLYDPVTFR